MSNSTERMKFSHYTGSTQGVNDHGTSRAPTRRPVPDAGMDGLRARLHAPGGNAAVGTSDGLRVGAHGRHAGARALVCGCGAAPKQGDEGALTEAVAQATDGDMASVFFEATGNASCTKMTTTLVAHAGRIVLVGWNKGPVEIDTVTLMRKEIDLLGSRNSINAFPAVLRLLADGVIDTNSLITHRFGLRETKLALELLDTGQEHALKILINAR